MVGTTLSHFRVIRALGAGGMGEVYLAEDTRLKRQVALKILPRAVAGDPGRLERFQREAETVAALNHPHIVTIYSVEEEGGVPFLTMELVEGRTLTELIPKGGLPLARLLQIAIPLADAVGAAHQRGITHRDLKPSNIMVGDDGRLKVLDFGLAKLKESAAGANQATQLQTAALTGEGRILGTVAYMSPEQAEGRPIDHRSDIFSLGVILYEMATARRPFTGDTSVSIISSIVKDTPAPVTTVNPELPRDLARIVRHCLAKDPTRRYQTALDLRNELEELKQEVDSGELDAPTHGGVRPRSRGLVIAALTGAAVLLAASFVVWRAGWGRPPGAAAINVQVSQLTFESGLETFPSVSPDGKWFIYVGSSSGNPDIYLQSVGGHVPINLTKDSPVTDTQPAFSPDGERIAFRSEREGGGLFVMGRTGDFPKRLTDGGFNPSWSPDGRVIFFGTESVTLAPGGRATASSQIWAVEVETSARRLVSKGDAVQPQMSPHGQRIAYWGLPGGGQRDIWTIAANGDNPVPVTNDPAIDWSPIWSPDGRYLYFSSDRGGSLNLWRVPLREETGEVLGAPEAVTTPSSFVAHLSIDREGRHIAFVAAQLTSNVVSIGFDPATGAVRGQPMAVTSGTRGWTYSDLSPDGRRLAFSSTFGQEDIFVSRPDGKELRQLTTDAARDRMPRWSPDGRRIVFYSDRSGNYEFWSVNPDGTGLQRVTWSGGSLGYPVWSPDGTRMAGFDFRTLAVSIFDPRKPWKEQTPQVLPRFDGGDFQAWSWSPDGRTLAGYLTGAGAGIVLYSETARTYQRLAQTGSIPIWLPDGRRLLYLNSGRVFLLDVASRASKELLALPDETIGRISLSHDGRQLFFTRGTSKADIWMATIER